MCELCNPGPSANGFLSFFIKKLNEGNKGKSLFTYIRYLAARKGRLYGKVRKPSAEFMPKVL